MQPLLSDIFVMKSNEAVTWLCYTELQKYMEELLWRY